MLTPTLLPPLYKNTLNREHTRRVIVFFGVGVSFVLILGCVLLLPSYFTLTLVRVEAERALAIEEEAAAALRVREHMAEAEHVRSSIAALRGFIERPKAPSDTMMLFLAPRPGIIVTYLAIAPGGKVTIQGTAATRRDLLNFEAALRTDGGLQDISSPLSNIIRETAINFSIEGTLKPSYAL